MLDNVAGESELAIPRQLPTCELGKIWPDSTSAARVSSRNLALEPHNFRVAYTHPTVHLVLARV